MSTKKFECYYIRRETLFKRVEIEAESEAAAIAIMDERIEEYSDMDRHDLECIESEDYFEDFKPIEEAA